MFGYDRKQVGFIVFGGGIDKRAWILNAREEGYIAVDHGHYAALYRK